MGHLIESLEARLCQYFGRRHCIAVGRCTSAIYATLRALEISPGRVGLCAISNPAPANAVLYAGLDPLFCDIDLRSFNIDVDSLERLIEEEQGIKAVIVVHLYGQPADMSRILPLAKSRGLYVIEDLAQAMGGQYMGRRLGSFGDVSVVSFAHTKIVDVGVGGAALTDEDELADRIRKEVGRLPPMPDNLEDMAEEYRKVYYSVKPLTDLNPRLNELFVPLPHVYRDMYLYQIGDQVAGLILRKLDKLEDDVVLRRRNALAYRKGLPHPAIVHPVYEEEGVFWRYSFLLKGNSQQRVSERIREEGFDISNWYPSLVDWYESGRRQDRSLFRNADHFAAHICNVWTEPSQSLERIEGTIKALLQILDDEGRSEY